MRRKGVVPFSLEEKKKKGGFDRWTNHVGMVRPDLQSLLLPDPNSQRLKVIARSHNGKTDRSKVDSHQIWSRFSFCMFTCVYSTKVFLFKFIFLWDKKLFNINPVKLKLTFSDRNLNISPSIFKY